MTRVQIFEAPVISFTIDDYRTLVLENKTHEVVARDGSDRKILTTERNHYNCVVATNIKGDIITYSPEGFYSPVDREHPKDLVIRKLPAKVLYFMNVYEDGPGKKYKSLDDCKISLKSGGYLFTLEVISDRSHLTHFLI